MMRTFNDVDLHAFVDDQLSPDRRATILAHLTAAPDDAARVEAWTQQNARIRALFAAPSKEPVPLWLTVGQIAAGRAGRDEAGRTTDRQPRRVRSTAAIGTRPGRTSQASAAVVALAFAAGLVVATAADRLAQWSGWTTAASAAPAQGFQQRAWEAHETFGLDPDRPVDVTDVTPGRVQTWLDSRVPFRTRVPDLRGQGWTLLGGRLAPADAGPGALLVYRDAAGDRLSLFSGRLVKRGADAIPAGAEAHGIAAWNDDLVGYAVLTSKGRAWLDQNAAALKQAVIGSDPAGD